ncbi:MAG: TAXI family TRAP transporter solute-binding subunit [bacterium]
MKRFLLITLCLLVVVSLVVGCSPSKPPEQPADQDDEQEAKLDIQMILATGGTAGTYYPLGGAIADVWNTNIPGANVVAQATGASVENMKLIDKKEAELCLIQNDIAEYAATGIEAFDGQPLNSGAGIATLYPEVIQIIVAEDSPVNSIKDIKGMRVSVGAPGSGNEANARQILETLGLTYDDIKPFFISYAESADQFKDGHIDVILLTTGAPNAGIQDVSAVKKIKFISLAEDEVAAIQEKYPFLTSFTMKAGTYSNQDYDVETVAVQAIVMIHKDQPDEVVYALTKALWENRDHLAQVNNKAEYMDIDDPVKGITIPIHPGAAKYYQEQGIELP